MLQRAGDSAVRLLRHLSRYDPDEARRAMTNSAVAMVPASELETAIMSLRKLIAILHKEPDTR